MKISKKEILARARVTLFSLKAYIGGFFGYFSANFLAGRLPSVVFDIGNYHLHFHHWFISLTTIILTLLSNFPPLINPLSLGFLSGVVFQGIFKYQDWYRIISFIRG